MARRRGAPLKARSRELFHRFGGSEKSLSRELFFCSLSRTWPMTAIPATPILMVVDDMMAASVRARLAGDAAKLKKKGKSRKDTEPDVV